MSRKAVYLLVTKSGPTAEQQLAAIRKVVAIGSRDETYTDDVTEKYRPKDRGFEQRGVMLRQLRRGDTVVVASPGRLGVGQDDVRTVLHALGRGGHPLIDASTGKTVLWTDEIADGVAFLARAIGEHKAGAAANAREARAARRAAGEPEQKPLAITEAEARQMWHDPIRYPSQKAVAETCGVSYRTLYNRFGPRHPQPALKRKRRK